MNNKIKNYLGGAIIMALLIVAYAAVNYVKTYSKSIQPSSFRSFSVSAEGKIVAVPDVAQFSFGVKTEGGKNIADLQKENTEKVNKAIEFVKSNGVDAKDIKTTNYSLTPRYQYCDYRNYPIEGGVCPPPEIVGYTISQTVSVKIRDFKKIGDILAGVIQNGANEVSSLSFTIDDPTLVQDQARNEAIAKAKVRAASVAKAGGFKLGRLLSIEEGSTPVYYNYATKAAGMGISDESATPSVPPAIEAGSQEVSVTMTLKYEIE